MGKETGISWADSTFNPWMGCTKVSPACDNCYAENLMDTRLQRVKWGSGNPRKRTSQANWDKVIEWNARRFMECAECGWRGECAAEIIGCGACFSISGLRDARRRVFCASLADVFDNEVDDQWRADLFYLMYITPSLDWLVLTKRVGNAAAMMARAKKSAGLTYFGARGVWPNLWLGATVVNQAEADRDIVKLLEAPAALRFVSIEPMLGPIELKRLRPDGLTWLDCLEGSEHFGPTVCTGGPKIDWVIAGGESGANARPIHPDWIQSLIDQCEFSHVPFLFKQWGEWQVASQENGHFDSNMETNGAKWVHLDGLVNGPSFHRPDKKPALDTVPCAMVKAGKKRAGNRFAGRVYEQWPKNPAGAT